MLPGRHSAPERNGGGTCRFLQVPSVLLLSLVLFTAGFSAAPARAKTLDVSAGDDFLSSALAAASPGDTLLLAPGEHKGHLTIDKEVTLIGQPGARIVGDGVGHVLDLAAPGIEIRGLVITGSGLKLESEDSGIFLRPEAAGATIENNDLNDNLIGVYIKGAREAQVRGNRIAGRRDLRVNERGNGIQIWNAPGAVVEDNTIRFGRDGIFVTTSKRNIFRNNTFRDLRFAVHYMYTNRSQVIDNRSFGNHVGYAIMFSKALEISGNLSAGDRDHGFLLNYTNSSELTGNRVTGGAAASGPDKCLFIYNTNKNSFSGNLFRDCGIGIHFTAGSEGNLLTGNAFLNNRRQVKYVGTRHIEWSADGRGNFWSDNLSYDLNDDGIADAPYHPNDLVDQILWRHPLAKLLLNSPAAQVLRWSQRAFPHLRPGGVIDSNPLMVPPISALPAAHPEASSGEPPA